MASVPEVTIRVATPGDEAAVSAMLGASYGTLMQRHYDKAALAAALPAITKASPTLLASGTYFVAEAGTESKLLVGCGGWTHERPGTGELVEGLGHIRHFGVHPNWIGRALGRSIYAACERQARAAGVTRFECYSSLNAEGFYAALGFVVSGRMEIELGPGLTLPSVLMKRSI